MKTIFKHLLATAVLLLVSVSMNAEVYSGDCGAEGGIVKWTYNSETRHLTISGSGRMFDYDYLEELPWYSFRSIIKKVSIETGVTSIGRDAFYGCSSLTSITIPSSVTSIGYDAFRSCTSLPTENNLRYADTYLIEAVDKSLSTYTIKEGTRFIGNSAFSGCSRLTSITIPSSVTSIGSSAFDGCI